MFRWLLTLPPPVCTLPYWPSEGPASALLYCAASFSWFSEGPITLLAGPEPLISTPHLLACSEGSFSGTSVGVDQTPLQYGRDGRLASRL
jgi:hypothetical protein